MGRKPIRAVDLRMANEQRSGVGIFSEIFDQMQDKGYGPKSAVEDSRLLTSGAPPLSHLPGFDDVAAAQSAAPKESEIWGPRSDARQSEHLQTPCV